MLKNIAIITLALLALALPFAAFADNYATTPNPTAVFDTTTGTLYAIGNPGGKVKTVVPSAGVATTWTAVQTLNAPVLNNPVVVGPAPTACGATCTLTAANAGQTTLLNAGTGSVATLPAATGTGNVYPFVVSVAVGSNKDAILAASSSDFIIGIAVGYHTTTTTGFSSAASTNHSIQMPFAGTQPSGGFAGDHFTCQDVGTNLWQCSGQFEGGAAPTTPFSSATS